MTFREAEEQYYCNHRQIIKQLLSTFREILTDAGLYDVDLIRKSDGKRGQIKVSFTTYLHIAFFPYTISGTLSHKSAGTLPKNITYLKEHFERVEDNINNGKALFKNNNR